MGMIDKEAAVFVGYEDRESLQDYSDGGYSGKQIASTYEKWEVVGFDALEESLRTRGEQMSHWFGEGPTWSPYNIPGEIGNGSEYTPREGRIKATSSYGKDYFGKLIIVSLKPEDEPGQWVSGVMDVFTEQAEKTSDFLRRMVTVRAVMRANEQK